MLTSLLSSHYHVSCLSGLLPLVYPRTYRCTPWTAPTSHNVFKSLPLPMPRGFSSEHPHDLFSYCYGLIISCVVMRNIDCFDRVSSSGSQVLHLWPSKHLSSRSNPSPLLLWRHLVEVRVLHIYVMSMSTNIVFSTIPSTLSNNHRPTPTFISISCDPLPPIKVLHRLCHERHPPTCHRPQVHCNRNRW
jgi:hypothetical protein